jgi:uncharacterized membrane protein
MDSIILARALHVLAVVIWIGGVAMATTVVIPAVRRGAFGEDRLRAFQAVEHRFAWQARIATLIVAISGFYMVWRLDLWSRFHSLDFWWMHAMVCVWLIFALFLFVGEPLVLHRRFRGWATRAPDTAFAWLQRVHWVLLILSLITIFGAVAGVHGWSIF